ncbi:Rtr1/RPAP2 family-domain-containing protein [Phascolomyces articulosus]|uniref:RNA polymerase II subunit B1 CTD phosphatase RPAP2 homolog n=1 Tax=Phascolomyces articulosus TaxID=60185 RepID=A0AAD5KGB2_9FUNG|nr:Rtr1/RPAP2 family-domain-containing protein [Phascolomyces articulosus]
MKKQQQPQSRNTKRPTRKPGLTDKQKLIKSSAEQRLQAQQLAFTWQEKLFSKRQVSVHLLRQAATILQPQTYDEVVEERAVQDYCGYPLCNGTPVKDQPRYRISLSQRKVFDQSELASYCSDECLQKSKYFRMQLSEEPVWFRDLQVQPSIQIVLPSQDLKKVLEKEKQQSQKSKTVHQIRQDYVQKLLENVSILPTTTGVSSATSPSSSTAPVTAESFETDTGNEIRIFENTSQNVVPPNIPEDGVHDAIEGFRIEMRRRKSQGEQGLPTTMILQTESTTMNQSNTQDDDDGINPPGSPTTVGSESVVFEDEEAMFENAMETMMMLKEIKADQPDEIKQEKTILPEQQNKQPNPPSSSTQQQQQNATVPKPITPKTVNIVIPEIPKPSSKKKKRQVPEMSLFGKIWTMTDRLTTKATRKYFEELKRQAKIDVHELLRDESENIPRDETSLMRSQIFSERILETYAVVRAQIGLAENLETDIINLIQTFRFTDASMIVLNPSETYMMTLVLFKALADVAIQNNSWQQNFESCCKAIGETGDTVGACVRVLRVAST